MDRKTHKKTVLLGLTILLCLWASIAHSATGWKSLTSFGEVRRMRVVGDSVYMATSGGLLIVSDTQQEGVSLTNVDGLGTVDLGDAIVDASGRRWVAGLGRLVLLDENNPRQYLFFNQDDESIRLHCLADDGDFLWIGTEIGLVYFAKEVDGGQIQDSYGRFGNLPDFPEVLDIKIMGDSLWLGTSAGLAVADKADPKQLKFPGSWTVFGSNLLGAGRINRVVRYDGFVYLATNNGLVQLTLNPSDTSATKLPIGPTSGFSELRIDNDSLFYYGSIGMGHVLNGSMTALPTTGITGAPTVGVSTGTVRWLSSDNSGLHFKEADQFELYSFTGMPVNRVADMAVGNDGVLSVAFPDNQPARPLAQYRNGGWQNVVSVSLNASSTRVMSDSADNVWVGTFGNGLHWYDGTNTERYNNVNSTLVGNNDNEPSSHGFVVIFGLATDGGHLFAAAYRAYNDHPLIVADMADLSSLSSWDAYGPAEGLNHTFLSSLDAYPGEVAVGTELDGVYICRFGENPLDPSSDICTRYTEDNSFLISNSIQTMRYSPDGTLWVGTPAGLSRFDWGIERFIDVDLPLGVDRDVRALEFDGRGNLWVGTREGLARLSATGTVWDVFNSLNSDLLSNEIIAVKHAVRSGETYVATASGISIIPSQFGQPVFDVEQVIAFPNPFVVRSSDDRVRFNFGLAGTVSIYSVAGELVRELPVNEGWDGRNESGNEAASGVYVFVLTDQSGSIGRGKILLVR